MNINTKTQFIKNLYVPAEKKLRRDFKVKLPIHNVHTITCFSTLARSKGLTVETVNYLLIYSGYLLSVLTCSKLPLIFAKRVNQMVVAATFIAK